MSTPGRQRGAARLGGVRVDGVRVATFALSGVAAAMAGVLDASRVLERPGLGRWHLTFTVLAGIVVGGTSILGGEGAVWRTVVGCLFIALIGNGFNLLGLDPFYQQITLGRHPAAGGRASTPGRAGWADGWHRPRTEQAQ